jgi:hypothetical protein
MRYLGIVAGILIALVAIGVAFADTTIPFIPRNNSGVTGTAALIPHGNQTEVKITLSGTPAGASEPASIHFGDCVNAVYGLRWPLNDVIGGSSDTMIDETLAGISASNYAIVVSESSTNVSNWVVCGPIPINFAASLPKSGGVPLEFGVLAALTVIGGGFYVRRGRREQGVKR